MAALGQVVKSPHLFHLGRGAASSLWPILKNIWPKRGMKIYHDSLQRHSGSVVEVPADSFRMPVQEVKKLQAGRR